ncbi:MAG: YciI family protein, partial [Pirellula sp.]|nr:YciI family protein [Pirellula sp.]
MYFILTYDVVEDYVARRAPFREEHLRLAQEYADAKKLLLGGALADPVDQAVLVFEVDSVHEVESFIARDPYVKNGLVR